MDTDIHRFEELARNPRGFNAEAQRTAEKRREEELSAKLCESLRLCVKIGLARVTLRGMGVRQGKARL